MTNGRKKGSKAELVVAKLFHAWWSQLEPEVVFVRTPCSGGWGTPKVRAGFRTAGDLMTDSKRFPFTVEVKRREWDLTRFERLSLRGVVTKAPIWGWWAQAQRQAEEQGDTPLLVFRRSHQPWRLMLPATRRHVLRLPGGWTATAPSGSRVWIVELDQLLATSPRRWEK